METRPDLTMLTAVELNESYRAGDLSPVEVTEAVLSKMDEQADEIGAFFTRTDDIARTEAVASEERFRRGEPIGPLDGVPYSIKDLEATAGIRTTYAIPASRDFVPDFDTAVAGRLRGSGGVLLGKTSCPQMGYKDSSENLLFPPTKNPWNLSRNPGGSSSGAAAAIASGFGALAQGSDGAGSIRIPAALCGVVGLKATVGRVPAWPQRFYFGSTYHNGPLTRSVRDAALMMDVIAGSDHRDPTSLLPEPETGYLVGADEELDPGTRFGVSRDFGYGAVAHDVWSQVSAATALLADGGWSVSDADPGWDDVGPTQDDRWAALMGSRFGDDLRERPDTLEPMLAELVAKGQDVSATSLVKYDVARGTLHNALVAYFDQYDYLITPTMPMGAWHRDTYPTSIDGVELPGGMLSRAYLVWPFNFTGNPAITIPCGLTDEGLPVGIQIVGRLLDDIGVLRVARVLESLIGFAETPSLQDRG